MSGQAYRAVGNIQIDPELLETIRGKEKAPCMPICSWKAIADDDM